jgi:hypothetical protein
MKAPVSRAGVLATIAAAVAVIAGLITLGLPSHARERRLDGMRVDDLVQLSNSLDAYWSKHTSLPLVLDSLVSDRQTDRIPSDPATKLPYTYLVSGERSYRLCATFAQPSDTTDYRFAPSYAGSKPTRSWRHGAGESCFDLTVTTPSKDEK